MSPWLKNLVVATALLAMPLQGIAATLSVLFCHGNAQAHVGHANHAVDRAAHGDSSPDEGGPGGKPAYHPCCHNIVSAATVATPPAALPDFAVRAFAPDSLHDLFVPDRPQRPPLA